MSFNYDKSIATNANKSASDDGALTVTLINKETAPLAHTEFNVIVSLTGTTSTDRIPLDLVVVLDISGSMYGDKLAKMKTATEYLINKLGPSDRVSVVTFNHTAQTLCPLREVTNNSVAEILYLVNAIYAHGSTNITDGLQMGLKVLNDHRSTDADNRVDVIMLMSDGEQNDGADAAHVYLGDLPVYTFGFGTDHEPKVLKAIADNSVGGTFSDVQDVDHLSAAFAQCLGGLLVVVAKDLTLTVTSTKNADCTINSTIKKVLAGNYKQSVNGDSVVISFGYLYSEEVRNVIVTLDLPCITCESVVDVLKVACKYRSNGADGAKDLLARVFRTTDCVESEKEEVKAEMIRVRFAEKIKQARVLAEGNNMDGARKELIEAGKVLEESKPSSSIDTMKHELEHLSGLMTSREVYMKQGRSYTFSFETSHDRQRFALRGHVEKHRMFAIPHMDKHFEEVKKM